MSSHRGAKQIDEDTLYWESNDQYGTDTAENEVGRDGTVKEVKTAWENQLPDPEEWYASKVKLRARVSLDAQPEAVDGNETKGGRRNTRCLFCLSNSSVYVQLRAHWPIQSFARVHVAWAHHHQRSPVPRRLLTTQELTPLDEWYCSRSHQSRDSRPSVTIDVSMV